MSYHTILTLSEGLARGEYSSVEIVRDYLDRIQKLDPQLNSFITVTPDLALAQAAAADEMRRQGKATPLTGIPIAHKDIFCTLGVKTTCGSKMLSNFIAPYDATVVIKCQQAGMVTLGKTNMDEFAMGSSNENSFFGPVKNPWRLTTVPGGSSGGSAAAVAAGLAPVSTGTDTGGSIRQPASLCGLTGLKPTYGRVSRYGMIAYASSLDQCGPFTRTAADAALVMGALAGFDPKDSTCIDHEVPDYTKTLNDSLQGLRIGLPKEYFTAELNPAIKACLTTAIDELIRQGAEIKEITLPHTHLAIPAYYVIAPAECSSNLSRYDGVRFGYRCEHPQDLDDLYKRSRSEGFGEEVKRRIMVGTYALSAGFYDAYYLKAQKIRRLISQDFQQALQEVDVIIGPTCPETAFPLGAKTSDPITMYLSDLYTIAANLAGLPALSIPAGFCQGLPVGMQLIGNYFNEAKILNIAHQYQQVTAWHQQTPTLEI